MKKLLLITTMLICLISISVSAQLSNAELLPGKYKGGLLHLENSLNHELPDMSSHQSFVEEDLMLIQSDEGGFLSGLSAVNLPRKSYFINAHFGASDLSNKSISDENWDIKKGFGYQIEFGYYKKIKPLIAIGVGLGVSSYANEISIGQIDQTITGLEEDSTIISPADMFDERIEYLSIVENTRVTYLDVPVFIEFGNPNIDKIGYYIKLGLKLSTPIADNFSGNGNYTVRGYYPDYQVELVDIPELGFVLNDPMFNNTPKYDLNSINLSGMVSGGITFPLSNSWILKAGAQYVYGFSDISKESDLTAKDRQVNVNHILENNDSGTFTRSFGVEIGLQYVIDLY